MTEEIKAQASQALQTLEAARVKAINKLVSKNTFTQKNAGLFGVLGLNFLIKKLDKDVNGTASDTASVKEIEEKLTKAKEAVAKLEAKLAEAQGAPSSDETVEQIIALAENINEDAAELSETEIAQIKDLQNKLSDKK